MHRGLRLSLAFTGTLAVSSFAGGTARAQTDKAGAESLLDQGGKLAAEHDYAAACPKFEESLRLYSSLNTEYFLADCYEHAGKMASAWIDFLEVAQKAHDAGESAKETRARERAALIEGKVPHLTIQVSRDAATGLKIERDGVVVGPGQWGAPMPVDEGEHVVVASSPGRVTVTLRSTLKGDGDHATVLVPVLELAPGPPPSSPAASEVPLAPPATAPDAGAAAAIAPRETRLGSQRTVGLILGGVGVASVAVGSIFGLIAHSDWSAAKRECTAQNCGPGSQAQNDHDSAQTDATVATVAFIAGGTAIAAGAVLLFTAHPTASSSSATRGGPHLQVTPIVSSNATGLWMRGEF